MPSPPSGPPKTGLFDEKYYDGHDVRGEPSPILPPGKWDWNAATSDLANWRNFEDNIGVMAVITDDDDHPIGWELEGWDPDAVEFSGSAEYFEGSSGADVVNLGPEGELHSMSANLGSGPDRVVFNSAWSLDFSTSSSKADPNWDDDVVVAGCDENPGYDFDIDAASIHTGRGSDVLYVRDAQAAGFDAGNLDGRTSDLDPSDGDDVAIFRGNMRDFRFFGGSGDDTAVWYVDEVHQDTEWLGPNFFGGGGSGGAIWGDPGRDRLVLVIPERTEIVMHTPTGPGQLLVEVEDDYQDGIWWDGPTLGDPMAKYCITCGLGPGGRKTMTFEYHSTDNSVKTGYFYVTAFEELQIGLGPNAPVYRLDDVAGTATLDPDLVPFEPPELDPSYCQPQPAQ